MKRLRLLKHKLSISLVNLFDNLLPRSSLINRKWYIKIKLKNWLSTKIKVGFGPITSDENDLAERKWRIDPVINEINRKSSNYTAGFFIKPEEMKNFDIIVIVKKFTLEFVPIILELKKQNKLFVYDIVDNPNAEPKYAIYFRDCPEFSRLMNGFILSSPLHEKDAKQFSKHHVLIEHPIINQLYKKAYREKNEINILAHGYYENLNNLKFIESIIKQIAKETGKKINLIYHSEVVFEDTEYVKYIKWTVENCFTTLIDADFAITIKKLHIRHQRTKPSTKLITFMAAGLPVICAPTVADRLVINHQVTGLIAYTLYDWECHLRLLIKNPKYCKQLGKAARASVLHQYSMSAITDKYIKFFETIRNYDD